MVVPHPPESRSLLWPHPTAGPWLVRVWWREQRGVPIPVGLAITSWSEVDGADVREALPRADSERELPRITAALLRSLPVGAVVAGTRPRGRTPDVEDASANGVRSADPSDRLGAIPGPQRPAREPARDDHYRAVAAVYAAALRAGRSPTRAVQEHYSTGKSTAASWVARARQRGFLPTTTRGRSGPLEDRT